MTVSYGAKGTNGNGTTSISPTFPSGITAGQLLVAIVTIREASNSYALIANPGWTGIGEIFSTFGSVGADAGPIRSYAFFRVADGSESGSLTISVPASTSAAGAVFRFSSSLGTAAEWNIEWASGEDTSSGTGYSVACTPHAPRLTAGWIAPGDVLFVHAAKPSDSGSWASQSITSTGLTIGSSSEVLDYTTSFGNDLSVCAWHATVSSGTQSSSTVTVSATITASYGPAMVFRIRDVAPSPANADVPVIVGYSMVRNNGQTSVWACPPVGSKDGDLIVAHCSRAGNQAFTDATSKGWWVLDELNVGARSFATLARIFDAADASTDYTLTTGSNQATSTALVAIRDHGVAADTDLLLGAGYTRPGSQSTTDADEITTPVDDYLALAIFGESSTSVGVGAQTTGDFDLIVEQREQGYASVLLNQASIYAKEMPTAGATGDVVLDYTAASSNGRGLQIGVPPVGAAPTGLLGIWDGALEDVAVYKTQTSGGPEDVEIFGVIGSSGYELVDA